MTVKREDLDQLKCEITVLPRKHYNHAARAIQLAEELMKERDEALAKLAYYEGELKDEKFR